MNLKHRFFAFFLSILFVTHARASVYTSHMTRPADEQRENAECEKCQTFESEQTSSLRRVSRMRVGEMAGCS